MEKQTGNKVVLDLCSFCKNPIQLGDHCISVRETQVIRSRRGVLRFRDLGYARQVGLVHTHCLTGFYHSR
jgi:hypothetical protein